MEEPGLGVQARTRRVIGDANIGAKLGELFERTKLSGARVGRRE